MLVYVTAICKVLERSFTLAGMCAMIGLRRVPSLEYCEPANVVDVHLLHDLFTAGVCSWPFAS